MLILLEPFRLIDGIDYIQTRLRFSHSFHSYFNFTVDVINQSSQFLHFSCLPASLPIPIFITAFYAKCTILERRELWTDLLNIHAAIGSSPWLLEGDFNAMKSLDEASGLIRPPTPSIMDFVDFIGYVAL